MPFITQGKTNWKFLLIVIVLALIVGGGALWYVKKIGQPYQSFGIQNTEEIKLNYKDVLTQMFPDKEFSEVQGKKDCFQDKENIFYCVENVKKDFLTESNQKNILVVIKEGDYLGEGTQPSYSHSEGLDHIDSAVFDAKTKRILTNTLLLVSDGSELYFFDCKDKTYILYNSGSGGQGLMSVDIGLYKFNNNKIENIWAWQDDGTITEVNGDNISVYKMQSIPPSFKCPTKCLDDYGPVGSSYVYSFDFIWDTNLCSFNKDETADWKTYTNKKYGFEIKYPKEYTIHDLDSDTGASIELPIVPGSRVVSRSIIATSNPFPSQLLQEGDCAAGSCYQTISGPKYCKENFSTDYCIYFYLSLISRNDPELSVPDQKEIDNQNQIYNQILSTFRFLE